MQTELKTHSPRPLLVLCKNLEKKHILYFNAISTIALFKAKVLKQKQSNIHASKK